MLLCDACMLSCCCSGCRFKVKSRCDVELCCRLLFKGYTGREKTWMDGRTCESGCTRVANAVIYRFMLILYELRVFYFSINSGQFWAIVDPFLPNSCSILCEL